MTLMVWNMEEYYQYNAYGLGIHSTILFPELIIDDASIDVKILFKDNLSSSLEFVEISYGDLLKIHYYNNNESIVIFDGESILKVKNGKEIIVNSKTSLQDTFIRALILSQGMGILLQQRGYLVLHANSVKMNDGAVIFIGSSGNGKSTLTFALNSKGYPLVTDDILAVKFDDNDYKAFPSFPRIKLWQDITKHFVDDPDSLYVIHSESQKFSYSTERFFSKPLPLRKIYILEKGEKNEIINLAPKEALIKLIRDSYNFKMFNDSEKSSNLFQCANLIKNVAVNVLKSNQSINEMNSLLELIEKDIFETK
jgi:hypothetical protein